MRKIDDHIHVVADGYSGTGLNGMKFWNGAELTQWMRGHEVERCVILSGGEDTPVLGPGGCCNRDVQALSAQYPDCISWMCMIDGDRPGQLDERLLACKAMGAVGVGEYVANYWIDDERIQGVFAACERTQMPILFHMSPCQGYGYGICDEPGLPQLERALKKFPGLTFIAHSQPFWYEIGGNMPCDLESRNAYPQGKVAPGGRVLELLDHCPNLFCDLSANSAGNAIMRDPEFGYSFLNTYQDRLIFGTDMCNSGMYFPLAAFIEAAVEKGKIAREAAEKIFRTNAIRVLKL